MRALPLLLTALVSTLFTSRAQAAPAATRVAILPLRDASVPAALGARIEAAVVEALQATPGFSIANLSNGKLTAPRKIDARVDPQPAARALALGRETNAARAIAVEATPLGDGLVIYLQALELPGGHVIGSTTIAFRGDARAAGDREALRAALVRVLDPSRYVGRVALKLDVQGAQLQVDGKAVPFGTIELPVGTHALRATHPAYHDFLRFLDVEFDKTLNVDVNMAMYPLAEGEMTERGRRASAPLAKRHLPWWRTWWALSCAGVVITGITVGAVLLARPGIQDDASATYKPMPTP